MGEIANWMIQGGGCQWCGVFIGGEVGYPRLCTGCTQDARKQGFEVNSQGQITKRPEDD